MDQCHGPVSGLFLALGSYDALLEPDLYGDGAFLGLYLTQLLVLEVDIIYPCRAHIELGLRGAVCLFYSVIGLLCACHVLHYEDCIVGDGIGLFQCSLGIYPAVFIFIYTLLGLVLGNLVLRYLVFGDLVLGDLVLRHLIGCLLCLLVMHHNDRVLFELCPGYIVIVFVIYI